MESGSFDVRIALRQPDKTDTRSLVLADAVIDLGGVPVGIRGISVVRRLSEKRWYCTTPSVRWRGEDKRTVELPRDVWLAIVRAIDAEINALMAEASASAEAGPIAA